MIKLDGKVYYSYKEMLSKIKGELNEIVDLVNSIDECYKVLKSVVEMKIGEIKTKIDAMPEE